MNEPLISVIIPCYNYDRFLPDAVDSVLAQSYANWECIIVDDGSTDASKETALKLAAGDQRIRYSYKTNGGLSSARNHGIELAKGEYLCFLDADDLLDKDKLCGQLQAFLQHPTTDVVYGKAMFFENGKPGVWYENKRKTAGSELSAFSGKGMELIALLTKQNITVVSSPLIKKSVLAKAGLFDTSYRSYEDWHFWLRCALVGCEFLYCNKPEVCTYIRFGHESMMSDKKKLVRAGIQLRNYMAKHLPAKLKPYNYYRLLRSYLKLRLT